MICIYIYIHLLLFKSHNNDLYIYIHLLLFKSHTNDLYIYIYTSFIV